MQPGPFVMRLLDGVALRSAQVMETEQPRERVNALALSASGRHAVAVLIGSMQLVLYVVSHARVGCGGGVCSTL